MPTDPPVAGGNSHDRGGGGAETHELCRSETKEGPIPAAAEGFQNTPFNAIPDEVEQTNVAGNQQAPLRRESAPQEDHHENAQEAQDRLVEEERDEMRIYGSRSTLSRARELGHAVLALDGDTPGQVGRRAVQPVSYTHLRAHETVLDLVCRLL